MPQAGQDQPGRDLARLRRVFERWEANVGTKDAAIRSLEEAKLELKLCFERAVGLAHSIARGSGYMSTGRQAGRVVA